MSRRYCVACAATQPGPDSCGTWKWVGYGQADVGGVGPFCTNDCARRFAAWPRDRQAAALVDGESAFALAQLRDRYQAEARMYAWDWEAVEPVYCPAIETEPETIYENGKQLEVYAIKGLARSRLILIPIGVAE